MGKIEAAKDILKQIGMPKRQQNDLCAYTLIVEKHLESKHCIILEFLL